MFKEAAIRRFGDHREIDLLGKKLSKTGANDGVVVDDGNSDHGEGSLSHRWRDARECRFG